MFLIILLVLLARCVVHAYNPSSWKRAERLYPTWATIVRLSQKIFVLVGCTGAHTSSSTIYARPCL
jgi:hypothetical protein